MSVFFSVSEHRKAWLIQVGLYLQRVPTDVNSNFALASSVGLVLYWRLTAILILTSVNVAVTLQLLFLFQGCVGSKTPQRFSVEYSSLETGMCSLCWDRATVQIKISWVASYFAFLLDLSF